MPSLSPVPLLIDLARRLQATRQRCREFVELAMIESLAVALTADLDRLPPRQIDRIDLSHRQLFAD